MTIYVIETWVLKPEKQVEFYLVYAEKWKKLIKEKPELFEEIKSWNGYEATFGTTYSGMNLQEYETMADLEKSMKKLKSEPVVRELFSELWTYLLPGSHREEIWRPVAKLK
jgi:hypothetical protein